MVAPFKHVDVSELMGSWPTMPGYATGGAASLLPGTLNARATILNVKKETVLGYNVVGQSFDLWVDVSGVPTQFPVPFTGVGNLSLDLVVSQINAAMLPYPAVARADNGFLRLESPNTGEDSYLRLESTAGSAVLYELGLFAGTESRGGGVVTPDPIDPDRQVPLPGQLSWLEGEPFEAKVFNRMAYQLGVNTDRNESILSKKRIAVKKELDVVYSSASPEGLQLSGLVYTGDIATPDVTQLESWFAVLDEDGNELTKEKQTIPPQTATATFVVSSDSKKQLVSITGGTLTFAGYMVKDEYYIKSSGFTGGASDLNGHPLKIIQYVSPTEAVISAVKPSTGQIVEVTQAGVLIEAVLIDTVRCRVDRVTSDTAGTDRVESDQREKVAATTVTRTELANRIVVAGAQFISNAVIPGDLAEWVGHSPDNPYSNNGFYRVQRVIDEDIIEVAAEDWGPVSLNPYLAVEGTVRVTTDGAFWEDPFLRFDASGAFPDNGQAVKVVYLEMSTLRDATDDPSILVGPGVRYNQELDYKTQKALLYIIGPSATSVEEWARQDRRTSLEDLDLRLTKEHDIVGGRHTDIRPDYIDMFPGNDGETLIIRSAVADPSSNLKMVLRDSGDTDDLFAMDATGNLGVRYLKSDPSEAFYAGEPERVGFESHAVTGVSVTFYDAGFPLYTAQTTYYRVTGIDAEGNETLPSAEVSFTNQTNEQPIITWDPHPGCVSYRVYRSTTPGSYSEYILDGVPKDVGETVIDDHVQFAGTAAGTPPTKSDALSSSISGSGHSWLKSLSLGGATPDALFNSRVVNASTNIAKYELAPTAAGDPTRRMTAKYDVNHLAWHFEDYSWPGLYWQDSGDFYFRAREMEILEPSANAYRARLGAASNGAYLILYGGPSAGVTIDKVNGDYLKLLSSGSVDDVYVSLGSSFLRIRKTSGWTALIADIDDEFVGIGFPGNQYPTHGLDSYNDARFRDTLWVEGTAEFDSDVDFNANVTVDGNLLINDSGILQWSNGTNVAYDMFKLYGSYSGGYNLSIGTGRELLIGSGESVAAMAAVAVGTTENLYLASDSNAYVYTSGNTRSALFSAAAQYLYVSGAPKAYLDSLGFHITDSAYIKDQDSMFWNSVQTLEIGFSALANAHHAYGEKSYHFGNGLTVGTDALLAHMSVATGGFKDARLTSVKVRWTKLYYSVSFSVEISVWKRTLGADSLGSQVSATQTTGITGGSDVNYDWDFPIDLTEQIIAADETFYVRVLVNPPSGGWGTVNFALILHGGISTIQTAGWRPAGFAV